MDMTLKEFKGKDITVRFDTSICQHAGKCVKGQPEVFNLKADPWIQPDKASDKNRLVEVIASCPSCALTYEWNH